MPDETALSSGAQSGRLHFERLTIELLSALRGQRSRPGMSRRLGYKSNIAQRWETGLCAPTATSFFTMLERLGFDVRSSIERFLRDRPAWLETEPLRAPEGVSAFLAELRGRTNVSEVAARLGENRYSVARWFKGTATPRLPQLLAVIEACSGRCLDFVGVFVDLRALPSFAHRAEALALSRELAYEHPLAHAVLRALELRAYRRAPAPGLAFIARHVGIDEQAVADYLERLEAAALIERRGKRYRPITLSVVDTGGDPARARALKLSWAELAVERLRAGQPGHSGYRLFAINQRDLVKLREVQLAFAREMQTIIQSSRSPDCVGLYCAQLLDLGVAHDNTFRKSAPEYRR